MIFGLRCRDNDRLCRPPLIRVRIVAEIFTNLQLVLGWDNCLFWSMDVFTSTVTLSLMRRRQVKKFTGLPYYSWIFSKIKGGCFNTFLLRNVTKCQFLRKHGNYDVKIYDFRHLPNCTVGWGLIDPLFLWHPVVVEVDSLYSPSNYKVTSKRGPL